MRRALLFGITCLLLLCAGCVNTMLQEREYTDEPLPSFRAAPSAPIGDMQKDWVSRVTLYLPDADSTVLLAEPQTITIRSGQTKQEACVEALLGAVNRSGFELSGQPLALAQVSNAVESSGEMVMVDLHSSARRLSERALFALRVAIANTLTGLEGVNYVGILVNGQDIGLDAAETMPTGLMAFNPRGDILTAWNQIETQLAASEMELQMPVALYFVSDDETSLLGKVRSVTFRRRDVASYAKDLLDELAKKMPEGNERANDVSVIVPSADWYISDPVYINDPETSAGHLELHFVNYLDDHLKTAGATRGMLFSSITYTLTNFIPQLEGVRMFVGGQLVTQMTLMDGTEWIDAGGMMRREHFVALSSDISKVYYPLANQSGILAVNKPIAQRFRSQPRALLRQLMTPPENEGLADVFPEGISDADILGILAEGDTILINLSDAFQKACEGLSMEQERNMVYCMVNTLTEIDAIKRVRFYVNGEQKPLAGFINMGGEFWRNPGAAVN